MTFPCSVDHAQRQIPSQPLFNQPTKSFTNQPSSLDIDPTSSQQILCTARPSLSNNQSNKNYQPSAIYPTNKPNPYFPDDDIGDDYTFLYSIVSSKHYIQDGNEKNLPCTYCGKFGHNLRFCRFLIRKNCLYCLGAHLTQNCPSQEWKQSLYIQRKKGIKIGKRGIKCNRCTSSEHDEEDCRRIVLVFGQEKEKQMNLIICLTCHGFGHFNCKAYPEKVPTIYN